MTFKCQVQNHSNINSNTNPNTILIGLVNSLNFKDKHFQEG